jgi:hypothetical protein
MKRSGLVTRIVLPPVAAFLLLSTYLVSEALGFRGLARPEAQTVSEAAALGEAARALQLIAAGQQVNAPQHVRTDFLDAGAYDVTPVEAAILGRHVELVRLLERAGVRPSDTVRAVCFARARLPEVLPDLGALPASASGTLPDIATTVSLCGKDSLR